MSWIAWWSTLKAELASLHASEVAPVWHHDVTNARTCQFSAVCLTVFPFEFRPRTFTIGFYGKNSIILELMILECSFPFLVCESMRFDSGPGIFVRVNRNYVLSEYVLNENDCISIAGSWWWLFFFETSKFRFQVTITMSESQPGGPFVFFRSKVWFLTSQSLTLHRHHTSKIDFFLPTLAFF